MTLTTLQHESLQQTLDRIYNTIAIHTGFTLQQNECHCNFVERSSPDRTTSPLSRISESFHLSPFERDVLALCAGVEIESRFAKLCASIHGDVARTFPTFGLAFSVFPSAHWSALSPATPLRNWKLVHLDGSVALLSSPLRIDEPILHYLLDNPYSDHRIQPYIRLLPSIIGCNSESHRHLINNGASLWHRLREESKSLLLIGSTGSDRQWVFQQMSRLCGYAPYVLNAADIPSEPNERERLATAWSREALLMNGALYIRTSDTDSMDTLDNTTSFVSRSMTPTAVEVREGSVLERSDNIRLYLPTMKDQDRRTLWAENLGPLVQQMNGSLERLVDSFRLDAVGINSVGTLAKEAAASLSINPGDSCLMALTWNICRTQARRSLDALAHRIEPKAVWNDLILPDLQCQTLRQIVLHVRRRSQVQNDWGFGAKYARGSGITALFSGPSGTGKTMAAEVIANELELDLYQIDLSAIISKYIGETEKHLRRIFDAADESGAVLLFDEADALFGKRSEVNDSHDRFANLQISYLLQRMESYRGVAILTTNMKQALDSAFLRRLGFIVHFPFPDMTQRLAIWQHVFPSQTPVAELDYKRLAQLNVPGGIIRNIAIHSAFFAAEDGTPVHMDHIRRASRIEYAKIDKPLTATETGGWT